MYSLHAASLDGCGDDWHISTAISNVYNEDHDLYSFAAYQYPSLRCRCSAAAVRVWMYAWDVRFMLVFMHICIVLEGMVAEARVPGSRGSRHFAT